MATKKPGGGCKTAGRAKRKREARVKPLSKFVRGVISAEEYFRQTKQQKLGSLRAPFIFGMKKTNIDDVIESIYGPVGTRKRDLFDNKVQIGIIESILHDLKVERKQIKKRKK